MYVHSGSEFLQVQNFCSFQNCQTFLQIIIDIKINTFLAFSENFKSDTFENFLIFMESTNIGIIPNTFHDFQKNFKSDTFENYKSFVSVEVQSHYVKILKTVY